jgi:transcriptional regulator with XRE-family HTH domain
MSEISDLLRHHRYAKGWTQQQLGDRIGTSQSQVSAWETGREGFDWAVPSYGPKLLEQFGYPEDLLVWWVEREIKQIEQTESRVRSVRDQAVAHHGKADVLMLAKLERLIEQAAAQHAQLIAFQDELKSLFGSTGDAGKEAIHGGLPEPAPLELRRLLDEGER